MEQREKLIELLDQNFGYVEEQPAKNLADYLLANGVVVLPCKVGDYVYIPDVEKNVPIRVRVQGISISVSGKPILRFGGYPVESAWGDECGKSWYLTHEEAEAALKKMEGEK